VRRLAIAFTIFVSLYLLSWQACAQANALPSLTIPEGLGVNIHFTDPQPGEMKMLADTGVKWVRMDFLWNGTERQMGVYDFAAYERLLKALEEYHIRPIFILDYANPLYDQGLSPHTEEGRNAFARWAAAAVQRFAGHGILWEIWNEPNWKTFWHPKPNTNDYIKLALEVGRQVRQVAPQETLIGPASARIPLGFLKKCLEAGLWQYWAGLSVHPYRGFMPPETVSVAFNRLRNRIKKIVPHERTFPTLSGEWGYSTAYLGMNEIKQGKFLARMWLTNLANGIPLSIWYDWHDDGPDPKNTQQNYGLVRNTYYSKRSSVYDPKPAFLATKTLTHVLQGFTFKKCLPVDGSRDYVLLFQKDEKLLLAAWTSSPKSHSVRIPASPGTFKIIGYTGEVLPSHLSDRKGLTLTLKDSPQYLLPEGPNEILMKLAKEVE
jgi:polysaccharide biosynthesis protein PslG